MKPLAATTAFATEERLEALMIPMGLQDVVGVPITMEQKNALMTQYTAQEQKKPPNIDDYARHGVQLHRGQT